MMDSFFSFPGPMGQPIRRVQNQLYYVLQQLVCHARPARYGPKRVGRSFYHHVLSPSEGKLASRILDTRIVRPIESENR